ncbi:MAG TPA: MJ0042-type zinc finger domain-containing protein, partial [Planctomycetota bacterium]|nr:MJ0042-type zinc finger domain-containing protein [Planctomycetota bacterium]
MARLIKCPRCQSQIDVTSVAAGSTVRCADCGAMIRVPTGTTGQYPKVPAAAPAGATKKETTKVRAGGRQTELFRKMSGTRIPGGSKPPSRSAIEAMPRGGYAPRRSGGNAGVMVGVGAGLLVLIVIMIFALQSKSNSETAKKEKARQHKLAVEEQNRKTREENARQDAEYEAALAAQKAAEADAKKGKKSLTKGAGGAYTAPPTFEPGAAKQAKVDPPAVDKDVLKEYEGMARGGKTADIVGNPARYMPALIVSLLSEDEPLARASFQALH